MILTLSCVDKPGIVHTVSGFLASRKLNSASHHFCSGILC